MSSSIPADVNELIRLSREAEIFAYSPYSNFTVGAALLCGDGTIYKGCNVENVSFGLCICAERTAIVKAVSEGRREFIAMAISASKCKDYATPCGACRQFMAEFGQNWIVYLTKPDGSYLKWTVQDLLPNAFLPSNLHEKLQ